MKSLNEKEKKVLKTYTNELKVKSRKTKKVIVVAMVGLVGSGKSSVAAELAKTIGATVINRNYLGMMLRRAKTSQDNTRTIIEQLVLHIIGQNGNVVLDSDYIDLDKRKSLKNSLQKTSVQIVYVRTIADRDIMLGRIVTNSLSDEDIDFFGEASSNWKGTKDIKAKIVKLRELRRRTPRHYNWLDKSGGIWEPKKLNFKHHTFDTSNPVSLKKQIQTITKQF